MYIGITNHTIFFLVDEDEKEEAQRQLAKIFAAETVGSEQETVRQLSIAAGEFRPIDTGDSTKMDVINTEILDRENTADHSSSSASQSQQGGKRKRRKKSSVKRRGSHQNSQNSAKPAFQRETAVFTLEDIEVKILLLLLLCYFIVHFFFS